MPLVFIHMKCHADQNVCFNRTVSYAKNSTKAGVTEYSIDLDKIELFFFYAVCSWTVLSVILFVLIIAELRRKTSTVGLYSVCLHNEPVSICVLTFCR